MLLMRIIIHKVVFFIFSLENLDQPANFYIILDTSNKDLDFPDLIKNHKNLNQLK